MQTVGSRASVYHGNAKHTSGGLTKKNLKKNKQGRIVSIKASKSSKKNKNLGSFKAKKGDPFGPNNNKRETKSKSKKRR